MQTEPIIPLFSDSPHDWPDNGGESEGYQNECLQCKTVFMGHKEAFICKKCYEENQARWNAMTPKEQAEHWNKVVEAMKEYRITQPERPAE